MIFAGRLYPRHEPRLRQPVMEADDLGLEFLDDKAESVIERRAVRRRHRRLRIDAELLIIGLERLSPAVLAGIVRHRRGMREKVQVDRFARSCGAKRNDLVPQFGRIQHGGGQ